MPASRVVVFGYGELALAALETLERAGVAPAAVVVPGNRRGAEVDEVAARARERRWPLLVQPRRDELAPFLEAVRRIEPDLLLVWSYSMILPPELLALAPLGAVNVHGGLLPEYRGGHVMNWAIINGERQTGVTLHYMDAGIDAGPVIADRRFPIEWNDDAASIRNKLKGAGQALLEKWWPAILAGTAPRVPQDESNARYYRMRTAEDGLVNWAQPSEAIYNLVRALVAPWPGAFTSIDGTKLVLRRVEPYDAPGPRSAPGTVTRFDDTSIRVATVSGEVALTAVEIDGRLAGRTDLERAGMAVGAKLG
jgi:methionyl-tRNA formyltransferase